MLVDWCNVLKTIFSLLGAWSFTYQCLQNSTIYFLSPRQFGELCRFSSQTILNEWGVDNAMFKWNASLLLWLKHKVTCFLPFLIVKTAFFSFTFTKPITFYQKLRKFTYDEGKLFLKTMEFFFLVRREALSYVYHNAQKNKLIFRLKTKIN